MMKQTKIHVALIIISPMIVPKRLSASHHLPRCCVEMCPDWGIDESSESGTWSWTDDLLSMEFQKERMWTYVNTFCVTKWPFWMSTASSQAQEIPTLPVLIYPHLPFSPFQPAMASVPHSSQALGCWRLGPPSLLWCLSSSHIAARVATNTRCCSGSRESELGACCHASMIQWLPNDTCEPSISNRHQAKMDLTLDCQLW